MKTNRLIGQGLLYVFLALAAIQTVYPLIWVLFGSFKSKNEFFKSLWGPPSSLGLENYHQAWDIGGFGVRYTNSIMITGIALLIIVVAAVPMSFALARLEFRGRGLLFGLTLICLIVPAQVMAIPLFKLALNFGIINNRPGVAVVYAAIGLPLSILLLHGFFRGIPGELEDAGYIDGLSIFGVLTRIFIPLVRPGLGLVVIFQFITIWNEYFLGFLLLRQADKQTIPLGLVKFFQDHESLWTQYFAALVITIGPVLAIFVLMQRQFIAGLTAGSVKG